MTAEDWNRARPIIAAGLVLLGVVILALAALQIRQVLAVLFLGLILGITLNPFVEVMARRKVPRVAAILLVYLAVAAVLAAIVAYAVFEASNEDFAGNIDRVREDYDSLQEGTFLPSSDEIERGLRDASKGALGGLGGQLLTVASAFAGIVTIMFVAILFSVTQDRLREVVLSFVPPGGRGRAGDLMDKFAVDLRGYARGEITAMTLIGVVTFVGLSIIGVPLAVPLAFIAFLFELLPMIGPWLALIPALAIGFTQGMWTGILVLVLYLGIQAFESYVVTPLVHGRASDVPALLLFVAVAIGGALMGILGALIALPLAVLLHTTYFEVVQPWNERRFGESKDQRRSRSTSSTV
jgi:predicted PurR-regulated permease PerM